MKPSYLVQGFVAPPADMQEVADTLTPFSTDRLVVVEHTDYIVVSLVTQNPEHVVVHLDAASVFQIVI